MPRACQVPLKAASHEPRIAQRSACAVTVLGTYIHYTVLYLLYCSSVMHCIDYVGLGLGVSVYIRPEDRDPTETRPIKDPHIMTYVGSVVGRLRTRSVAVSATGVTTAVRRRVWHVVTGNRVRSASARGLNATYITNYAGLYAQRRSCDIYEIQHAASLNQTNRQTSTVL